MDTDMILAVLLNARQPGKTFLDGVTTVCGMDSATGRRLQKRQASELYEVFNTETAYGAVTKELQVMNEDGVMQPIVIVDPCSLMVYLASSSLDFFNLMLHLTQTTVSGMLGFVIYQDGVTPGNNLRPDHGRRFFSWMWTIRELPKWLTEIEWNLLAYIRKDYMTSAKLTTAIIARAFIRDFFCIPIGIYSTLAYGSSTGTVTSHFVWSLHSTRKTLQLMQICTI